MELNMCSVFLLLIGCVCLQRVGCRLPDCTPESPGLQVGQVHAGRTGACWEDRCMLACNLMAVCFLGQVEVSESHDFRSLQKKNESHDFRSLQKKNESHDFRSLQKKNRFRRLPGLCRRLKRRRLTFLCNREQFCWPTQTQKTRPVQRVGCRLPDCTPESPGLQCNREQFCWPTQTQKTRPVQVCLCPRGSRCSHFFVHSL
ncbi:uncharacterized protein LOC144514126 [Sander vitreus]